jgi:hypothetical protein
MEDSVVTSGTDVLGTIRGLVGDYVGYLSKRIDSERSGPMFFNDPAGNQYALANGSVYTRGAAAGSVIAPAMLSQLLVIGVVVVGAVLAFKALKG